MVAVYGWYHIDGVLCPRNMIDSVKEGIYRSNIRTSFYSQPRSHHQTGSADRSGENDQCIASRCKRQAKTRPSRTGVAHLGCNYEHRLETINITLGGDARWQYMNTRGQGLSVSKVELRCVMFDRRTQAEKHHFYVRRLQCGTMVLFQSYLH